MVLRAWRKAHRQRETRHRGRLRLGNQIGAHFIGAPFGATTNPGIGREERPRELLSFTQVKNVHVASDGGRFLTH